MSVHHAFVDERGEALRLLDRLTRGVPQRIALEPGIARALGVDPDRDALRLDRFPERMKDRLAQVGPAVLRADIGDPEPELRHRALQFVERALQVLQRQHEAADNAIPGLRGPFGGLFVAPNAQCETPRPLAPPPPSPYPAP